jgi:hypothetical protein
MHSTHNLYWHCICLPSFAFASQNAIVKVKRERLLLRSKTSHHRQTRVTPRECCWCLVYFNSSSLIFDWQAFLSSVLRFTPLPSGCIPACALEGLSCQKAICPYVKQKYRLLSLNFHSALSYFKTVRAAGFHDNSWSVKLQTFVNISDLHGRHGCNINSQKTRIFVFRQPFELKENGD